MLWYLLMDRSNNCGNGKILLMPIVQPRIEVNDDHVDVSTEAREAAVITA